MADRSLDSMHAIVCAAAEALDLRELAALALPHLARAFDTSLAGCYEMSEATMLGYMIPDAEPFERYLEYAYEDPLQSVKLQHNPCVAVTTDIVGACALRKTAVYTDVFRPFHAERHLVLRFSDRGYGENGVSAIVLARSGRQAAWSRADEHDLMRLRPAFAAFSRRYLRWRAAARGAPRAPSMRIAFDLAGRVLWTSPDAVGMITRSGVCRLPERVQSAVRRLGALGADAGIPREVDANLSTLVDGRRFVVSLSLASSPETGERQVIAALAPEPASASPLAAAVTAAAERHSLSPAETAVLREMALGGTNLQIGTRLSISPNTVRTHLMRIFPKLGVHTRTAALAKLGEALGG